MDQSSGVLAKETSLCTKYEHEDYQITLYQQQISSKLFLKGQKFILGTLVFEIVVLALSFKYPLALIYSIILHIAWLD